MGAGNAVAVFTTHKTLPHPAKVVLLRMALMSRDADTPPRYFGGWELLAAAINKPVPSLDPKATAEEREEIERLRHNARNRVNTITRQLQSAGAIRLTNTAHAGERSEYELILLPVDDPP